jgi:hypothetical protein
VDARFGRIIGKNVTGSALSVKLEQTDKGLYAPDSFGRNAVKSTQFDHLLASTALALVLALSSQAGMAQQTEKPVEASVPMPDTSLPPPLTAKDIEAPAKQAAPAKPAWRSKPKNRSRPPCRCRILRCRRR